MSRIPKKTIENLKEFMDRNCEYAGTQEAVDDLALEALKECSSAAYTDEVALYDCDDEFITTVGEFADIFWDKAVEKILCVLETEEWNR